MLKLESFKDDKFTLSESENSLVNGGLSIRLSYETFCGDTGTGCDNDTMERVNDSCIVLYDDSSNH